jgi:hypothetical protein
MKTASQMLGDFLWSEGCEEWEGIPFHVLLRFRNDM